MTPSSLHSVPLWHRPLVSITAKIIKGKIQQLIVKLCNESYQWVQYQDHSLMEMTLWGHQRLPWLARYCVTV